MERKKLPLNVFSSILLQIVTIISGFVVPRIIITTFGSETNGLISSITQFLNYVSLLEGGVSGVIMATLYKPLAEKDENKISGIMEATQHFFRQIGIIYIIYMAIVAFIYPLFVETTFSYDYLVCLNFVLGFSLFIQYFFSLTYRLLLNADRKVYIVSFVQVLTVSLNMILVILVVKFFGDILVVKIVSATVFLLQPILFGTYVKKHYCLNKNISPDKVALKQRWDGFGQNLAFFIHTNTDVVILTFFSSLSIVSVYTVYFTIVSALKSLVSSISSAIVPSMGNIMAKNDKESINSDFLIYEFGIYAVTTILFTCSFVLLVPFVNIYISGVVDVNYEHPVFAFIITLAEMIYCFRDPYINMAYVAGHFKQTAKYAYIEAILNIVISIAAVQRLGLVGIALGTAISMAYRMFVHVVYLRHNIINRSMFLVLKNLLVFGGASSVVVVFSRICLRNTISNMGTWFITAVIVFILIVCIISIMSLVFYKDIVKEIIHRMRGRK